MLPTIVVLPLGALRSSFHLGRQRDSSAPKWCPHLAPTPGPAARRDTLDFCYALTRAHKLGLDTNHSLVVDVGTDQGTEALTARGFGHHVVTFECRGEQAQQLSRRLAFRNDTRLKLVHACISDRAGLGTLHRAADSSSMSSANVQVDGASWKARREVRLGGFATETIPVMTLDHALDERSMVALGWGNLGASQLGAPPVGFLKIDVQGLEGAVLRGAVDTLRRFKPFVFYEDSMLPAADRKGALLERIMRRRRPASSGPAHLNQEAYSCECKNDCFCTPT